MDIILGTAGHIDHGKTALIRALTGVDADRLPEEKQRGITIDLGFAELEFGGLHIGFIDVPGHERFVKNMLAGASGIDAVMLIIAADEGVMPQTREHFEICRLLGIRHGVIVLTKSDLVDAEMLELAELDAAGLTEGSFLADAPIVSVSATTGEGLDVLKERLVEISKRLPARNSRNVPRLQIDRSFSVKGFGAVVTGTVTAGRLAEGGEAEILPAARPVRLRGLQTHGRHTKEVHAGMRAAANLGGIDHADISRGMTLAEKGVLRPTQLIDAEAEALRDARPLRSRQRVRLHIGSAEVLARLLVLNDAGEIAPGETGFLQFRLESPVVALAGDRFVIRSYSPQATIAGGRILHPAPSRHKRRGAAAAENFLRKLADAETDSERIRLYIENAGDHGLDITDIQAITGLNRQTAAAAVEEVAGAGIAVDAEGVLVTNTIFERLSSTMLATVEDHHKKDPLARGISRETLRERVFRFVRPEIFRTVTAKLEQIGAIVSEQDVFRAAAHTAELTPREQAVTAHIVAAYVAAGIQPPKTDDLIAETSSAAGASTQETRRLLQHLVNKGEIIKVTEDFYFAAPVLGDLAARLRQYADGTPDRLIDVPKFKDIAGVSRKFAIPLLEYFDREKVTIRAGDKRVIRK